MSGIGDRIRKVRGKLTQGEFGNKLGVSQAVVSSIEVGRTEPDTDFLLSLVKHFDVDLNWLISGESQQNAVRGSGGNYVLNIDADRLARDLEGKPKLLAVVHELLKRPDILEQADALAKALKISREGACLVLIMKETAENK